MTTSPHHDAFVAARQAGDVLAATTGEQRRSWLRRVAERLEAEYDAILRANDVDMKAADRRADEMPQQRRTPDLPAGGKRPPPQRQHRVRGRGTGGIGEGDGHGI